MAEELELKLPVYKLDKGELHLTQYIGKGKIGDTKLELANTIPEGSLLVRVEGTTYLLRMMDFVKRVLVAQGYATEEEVANPQPTKED